jgi:hypothetical protein
VLACPKAADDEKRAEIHASLCGKAIWIKYLLAQDDWTPVPVKLTARRSDGPPPPAVSPA